MATRIQVRRDTAGNWTSANPTLASGEIGLVTDSNKVVGCKIGTGSTAWTALEYAFPVLQTGANVNTAGDNTDATFLLKGLSGQSAAVFGIEETGATDLVLEINKSGDITIRNDADNSTQLTIVAETGNTDIVNGTLDVGGAVDFDSTLNVDGAVTMQDDVTINANDKMFKIQNNSDEDMFTVDTDNGDTVIAGDITANGNITGDDACTLYAPADNAHGWAIDGASGGGGSVVQMQYKQWTTPQDADPGYSTYTGSWGTAADAAPIQVTPITITITPTSVNSIIVVEMAINGAWHYPFHCLPFLKRTDGGTSAVTVLSAAGAGDRDHCIVQAGGEHNSYYFGMLALKFFDRPASTSAITYDFWFSADSGYQSFFWINRKGLDDDTNHWHRTRCCSWMTATEIAAKA